MRKRKSEPYRATWASLASVPVPEWFRNAKFGIFIHWGIYSVPAFQNEWYPRFLYNKVVGEGEEFVVEPSREVQAHHTATFGDRATFGYKEFIPRFTMERWDPDEWVGIFRGAGARYVVPVAEHHDGFPRYATRFSRWNAARMGPKRDLCADLAAAVRRAGLKFGLSTHRAHHWDHYQFDPSFDNWATEFEGLYGKRHEPGAPIPDDFVSDWYERTVEIIDRFAPDLLYFDYGWHRDAFAAQRPRIVAHYYNHAAHHGYEPVLLHKDKVPKSVGVFDVERGKLEDTPERPWQTDTSVSYRSWGYLEEDAFKSARTIVGDLADIVSKNGNLLLNLGPRCDGTIPEGVTAILSEVGRWLIVNGEAIYGTRPWWNYGEGPTRVASGSFTETADACFTSEDIRYTTKNGTVYAIVLGEPETAITLALLGSQSGYCESEVTAVTLLGSDEPVRWRQDPTRLVIEPPSRTANRIALAFRVEFG
jgi:alpha-L-fucosidase